jgi:cell division protein DivIC
MKNRTARFGGLAGLAILFAVPMLIYAGVTIGGRWIQARTLAVEAESLRNEVVSARAENQQLQTRIAIARSDQAIESIAREELGLIKPGDTPVVLIGASMTPTVSGTPKPAGPGR